DIPLQHGSTKMLQIMRRGITRPKTEDLLREIRSRVPGIAIRTTLIAGHPGETEADFDDMIDFITKARFERLGVFTYSHDDGTHSHTLQDNVEEAVKQQRAAQVMQVQESISMQINQTHINQIMPVLVDRREGGTYFARTEYDSP